MLSREEYKQKAAGRFYLKMKNEVGQEKITDKEIDIYIQGAMDTWDELNKLNEGHKSVRLPLYNLANVADLPYSKL